MMMLWITLLVLHQIVLPSSTAYFAIQPAFFGYALALIFPPFTRFIRPPYTGVINSFDPRSSAFELYGNFSFRITPDYQTQQFNFQAGPVAAMNNNASTIFTPLQSHASIQRLLLLRYDIQTKTYAQSSWTLDAGEFEYLHYGSHRQRLFGLREVNRSLSVIEEYDTSTLNPVQTYTEQDTQQYGFPQAASIFDPEENWLVDIRVRSESGAYRPYFMKMDLNLVGKKDDIIVNYHPLVKLGMPSSTTYDTKTKRALLTWRRGEVVTETVMLYMDPYTGEFQKETLLLKTPVGLVIQNVQALFDESTRQVTFLIRHNDLQHLKIIVWLIIVDFDTMKILEKKQIQTVIDLAQWTFFKI